MEEQQPGSSSPVARPGDAASGAFLSPPRTRAKERRNPSITPRKFRRFFTPRPRVVSAPSAARRALRDLAGPALNNRPTARITPSSSPLKPLIEVTSAEDGLQFVSQQSSEHPAKRRKVAYGTPPASSPVQQQDTPLERGNGSPHTPLSSRLLGSPIQGLSVELDDDDGGPSDLELADSDGDDAHHDRPLRQLSGRGMAGQLFQRELGCMPRPGRQFLRYPVCGMPSGRSIWQSVLVRFGS